MKNVVANLFALPRTKQLQKQSLGAASDLIKYLGVSSDGFLTMTDGSVCRIIAISGPPFEMRDVDNTLMVADGLRSILNQLPAELQRIQVSSFPRTEDYASWIETFAKQRSNIQVGRELHAQRVALLRDAYEHRRLRRITSFIVLIHDPLKRKKKPSQNFLESIGMGKKEDGIAHTLNQDFSGIRRRLSTSTDLVCSALRNLAYSTHVMDGGGVTELLFCLLNPARYTKGQRPIYPYPVWYSLNDMLLRSVITLNKHGFAIDQCHHRILSLGVPPLATSPASAYNLFLRDFNDYRITLNLVREDKEKALSRIGMRQRFASGMMGSVVNQESRIQFEQADAMLMQLRETNEQLYFTQLVTDLWGEDLHEVEVKQEKFMEAFAHMDQAECYRDEKIGIYSWLNTLPGHMDNMQVKRRGMLLKALNAAHLMPIFSPFEGEPPPGALFENVTSGLAGVNLFSDSVDAYNACVLGGTGGGKSFLTNMLLYHYQGLNPLTIIVDIGGSYQKMTDLFGGQYVKINIDDTDKVLNPFHRLYSSDNPSILAYCKNIMERMIVERGESFVKKSYLEDIESALLRAREDCRRRNAGVITCSDVYAALQTINPELAKLLMSWTRGREKGNFVDGRSTITLQRDVVCFDFEGLGEYPDLQELMLLIIINFIWEVLLDPKFASRPKIVVFDEVWKLLSSSQAGRQLVGDSFRTFRKHGTAAVAVTQSLGDLMDNDLHTAIVKNCFTWFLLKQSVSDHQLLNQTLGMNENELANLRFMQKENGVFADFFLYRQLSNGTASSGVLRNAVTPEEYWLCTSSKKDRTYYYEKLMQNQGNHLATIKACAAEYPQGYKAS